MNNMKNSSIVLFSIYQYSYAYELEQSPYVDHLTYRTLCLIIHTMYMVTIRTKLRWRFVVPRACPCPMLVDP
jgi:antibiotic biosynthesis monooxygenase (ABM) superfamily enzyme